MAGSIVQTQTSLYLRSRYGFETVKTSIVISDPNLKPGSARCQDCCCYYYGTLSYCKLRKFIFEDFEYLGCLSKELI